MAAEKINKDRIKRLRPPRVPHVKEIEYEDEFEYEDD